MNARRIHSMYLANSRQNGRDHRFSQFMNQHAESSVFLRWSPDDGNRPDGIGPVIYVFHTQHRKIMYPRIISQMIAERSFRL